MNSKNSLFMILFIVMTFTVHGENIKVLSSSGNSLLIEYIPTYVDTSFVTINNENFLRVSVYNGVSPVVNSWGKPDLQEYWVNVGVPGEFGNTIEIISADYINIKGKITPVPKLVFDGEIPHYEYLIDDSYYIDEIYDIPVKFGVFGISRGLPIQQINIAPIHFSPFINNIKIYTRIVFRINFSSPQKNNQLKTDPFLVDAVLNYNQAKGWKTEIPVQLQKLATNSLLAAGKWVRFEAPIEGIYRINKSLLQTFGIDPNTVDPRTIKIYNNSGKMLPENFNDARPEDLVENAIFVAGEQNGQFNDNDFILFYGRGNHFWEYDTSDSNFKRHFHLYSNNNYYWITSGGNTGKRMSVKQSLNDASQFYIQSETIGFAQWDEDKVNIAKSGRYFFGDEFNHSTKSRTYISKLDGHIGGTTINYRFRFVNSTKASILLQLEENNSSIFSNAIAGTNVGWFPEYIYGAPYEATARFTGHLPENRSQLKFTFNANSPSSFGYLDYFEISYRRDLKAENDRLTFYSKDTTSVIQYTIFGFSSSNIQVFDVTDYANVKLISNPVVSGSQLTFKSNEIKGMVSKYITVGVNGYENPVNAIAVENSNIRGITLGSELIIITPEIFKEQAERLKNHKETNAPLPISTTVINLEHIFNEFSAGIRDVTAIRDFLKYAYNNWNIKPYYVILFGNGSYDYKNIEGRNNNFIPTWQTVNSWHGIDSYTSDDYYGRVTGSQNLLDLAIGRINARSLDEIRTAVDKIIEYEKNIPTGNWRNVVTLVADDELKSFTSFEGSLHTKQSEDLDKIIPVSFSRNKIYTTTYPTIITGSGRRKPEANQAIIDAINNGTLLINFIGHGSPSLWTDERVFVQSITIPQLINDRYFFLTAATCDFGYYDIPDMISATEELLLKPKSGAIGAFTSARPVFSVNNAVLNNEFYGKLLNSERDTLNLLKPVGIAHFLAKTRYTDSNAQKFHLYGDPTIRLAVPQYSASFDSINGIELVEEVQIKALSNVTLNGMVLLPDKSPWTNFSGEAYLTVYDSERFIPLPQMGSTFGMMEQGGVIFNGRISVNNGMFNTNFVVPKDISYENKQGKMILYFYDDNIDGIGFTNKIIVGGTDTTAVDDGKGPEIEIYFDDTHNQNAYIIKPNSTLIVKLSDETGLNTTGTGVGHKLEGILNDDENNPIDFTNYFIGDLDAGGKSGQIRYRFNNFEEGDYKIEIKAWDVFNNLSQQSTNFTVVSGDDLVLRDVLNYPNPFSGNTTFTFQHNFNQAVDVKIRIYTIAGRMIKTIDSFGLQDRYVKIDWDGNDQDGSPIANGTYLYKVHVSTVDGEFNNNVLGKLAVIR